jgi:hypothetical protein
MSTTDIHPRLGKTLAREKWEAVRKYYGARACGPQKLRCAIRLHISTALGKRALLRPAEPRSGFGASSAEVFLFLTRIWSELAGMGRMNCIRDRFARIVACDRLRGAVMASGRRYDSHQADVVSAPFAFPFSPFLLPPFFIAWLSTAGEKMRF